MSTDLTAADAGSDVETEPAEGFAQGRAAGTTRPKSSKSMLPEEPPDGTSSGGPVPSTW